MKLYHFLLLYLLCSTIHGFGQNAAIKDSILNMYRQVKVFDYNSRFVLDFSAWECTYQVLVNDVPVMNSNEPGNVNGAVYPFSEYILGSGKQTITIKLYPAMGSGYKKDAFLSKNGGMKIKVLEGDYHRQKPDDYKVLYEFETPAIEQENLPYAEFKGVFEAEVPDRGLTGWLGGVDLRKEDPDKLLKEVIAKYEGFRNVFEDKDVEGLAAMLYKRQLDFAKAYYQNKPEQSKEIWDKYEKMVSESVRVHPLDQYRITFYGNGKIVALDRTDVEYNRKAIIISETKKSYDSYSIKLYRPSSGGPLEVIQ